MSMPRFVRYCDHESKSKCLSIKIEIYQNGTYNLVCKKKIFEPQMKPKLVSSLFATY
jgi:hypothetical protein